MSEHNDQEENIVSAAKINWKCYLYRTYVWLICELNFLLHELNFLRIRIDPSNFKLILILFN